MISQKQQFKNFNKYYLGKVLKVEEIEISGAKIQKFENLKVESF